MFFGLVSFLLWVVTVNAYFYDVDPFELVPPGPIPPLKTIKLQPGDTIQTTQSGESSPPLYLLDDTSSSANLPAVSYSIINIFGVKTSGGSPTLTLFDETYKGRSIEFQLGNPCRLNVTGMNNGGLWVAQSSIKDYSSNSYRWFTLERNPNYIAVYEPRDHSYPIMDYDNLNNDKVDFTTFSRFTVRSPGHPAQWDFLGYHLQSAGPLKCVFRNKFVAHALEDVKEQLIRFLRRRWRCDYAIMRTKQNIKTKDFEGYRRERCVDDLVRYSEDQEQRLQAILMLNGIPIPSPKQYNDSLALFGV